MKKIGIVCAIVSLSEISGCYLLEDKVKNKEIQQPGTSYKKEIIIETLSLEKLDDLFDDLK